MHPEDAPLTDGTGGRSAPLFITGATSPLGLRVVRRLVAEGYELCCLLRSSRHERELFTLGVSAAIRGDCEQPGAWESALEGIGLLVHLAPIARVEPAVMAARRHGVPRCIVLSSTRGFSGLPDPVAEGVRRGEAAVEASGLDFTLLRCAMIYGSRQDANIQRVAAWLDRHSWLPLIAGGAARIQPIHIDDVAEAILRTLQAPERTRDAKLILAGPSAVSWREMAETLAAVRGQRFRGLSIPLRPARWAAGLLARAAPRFSDLPGVIERFAEDRCFDIDETLRILDGWRPVNLREGLERTYASPV